MSREARISARLAASARAASARDNSVRRRLGAGPHRLHRPIRAHSVIVVDFVLVASIAPIRFGAGVICGAALQLLIQMSRNPVDGYRYISEISEVVWDGASRVTTLPLFAWAPEAGAPIAEGWKAINRPSFWADRLAPIWGPHWPDPWAAVTPAG